MVISSRCIIINYRNIYATNVRLPKYIEQISKISKGSNGKQHNKSRGSNTTFSTMDTSSRQKISKKILHMNYTLNQMNLTDIERLWLNHADTLGFLAPGGEEFNPGPEMRLDGSELLCNKVLLKCKGDRGSF